MGLSLSLQPPIGIKNRKATKLCGFRADESAILVGVTGFEPAASTSQTSRATNCATPRSVIFIRFLVCFCKWSNLWSSLFLRGFFVFLNVRKPQHLQGFSAVSLSVELKVGHTLPKHAAIWTAPHLIYAKLIHAPLFAKNSSTTYYSK